VRCWYATPQFSELMHRIFANYALYQSGNEFFGELTQIERVADLLQQLLVPELFYGNMVLDLLPPNCRLECKVPTTENLASLAPFNVQTSSWAELPAAQFMSEVIGHVGSIMKTFEPRNYGRLEAKSITELEAFYHIIFHACLKSQLRNRMIGSEVHAGARYIDTLVESKQDRFVIEFKRKPKSGWVSCKDAIAQCLIVKDGLAYFDVGLKGSFREKGTRKEVNLGERTADHVYLVGIVCSMPNIEAEMVQLSQLGDINAIKSRTTYTNKNSEETATKAALNLLEGKLTRIAPAVTGLSFVCFEGNIHLGNVPVAQVATQRKAGGAIAENDDLGTF